MDKYKCIKDYFNVSGAHLFRKGEDYMFNRVEYCKFRWAEIEYRHSGFCCNISEKEFKRYFINLAKKRNHNLVKLLGN